MENILYGDISISIKDISILNRYGTPNKVLYDQTGCPFHMEYVFTDIKRIEDEQRRIREHLFPYLKIVPLFVNQNNETIKLNISYKERFFIETEIETFNMGNIIRNIINKQGKCSLCYTNPNNKRY